MARFVGREAELAELHRRVELATAGQPSMVLVGGDAGIGKTRLLRELAASVEHRVLWGACLPMGERGVPYLPIVEMLRALPDPEAKAMPPALQVLVPGDRPAADPGPVSRSHLLQSIAGFVEELAERRPTIVVVEDLHWADQSTMDVLDLLGGRLHDQRLLLLASFRTMDLSPDDRPRQLIAEWSRRATVQRMELEPLGPSDAERLVASRPGAAGLRRDAVARLVQRAGGNPYFLEELAAAGSADASAPAGLRDFLLHRASGQPEDLTRLLRIASAGGPVIDEAAVSEVAGLPSGGARDLLRTAIEAGLLVLERGQCRFRHALLAEVFHDDLLPDERREYHAAFADVLARRSPAVPPSELATHQAAAGRTDAAIASWVDAAAAAERQLAFAEARHALSAVIELWPTSADPARAAGGSRGEVLRRLAEDAFLGGDAETAVEAARAAIDEVDPARDPVRAGLLHHELARYLCDTPQHAQALANQERALELVATAGDSAERAEVLAGLAWILQFEGRYEQSMPRCEEAIALADATGAVAAGISARNTLGNMLCVFGSTEAGLRMIGEALQRAVAAGDAHEQFRARWNHWSNLFGAARWTDVVAEFREIEAAFPQLGQAHQVPEAMTGTADALMRLGRWDEADAMIAEARRRDPLHADQIGLPELHVARLELDRARALIAARAASETATDTEMFVWNLVNAAEVEVADGNPQRAIELIDDALARSATVDYRLAVGYAVAAGARAAADLADAARVRGDPVAEAAAIEAANRYHGIIEGLLGQPGGEDGWKREVGALAVQSSAERTRAEASRDVAAWSTAADRWAALEMPYHAAYCRYRWLGAMLTASGSRDEMARTVDELLRLAGELGARRLADDVRRVARRARIGPTGTSDRAPFGLTEREIEVLSQIVRGATNRQIAAALFISEKTASVHVSNILRKLDVANRAEASAIAVREALIEAL